MRQNPLLLPAEAGFAPAEMSGLRKAAILMVALGDELAKTLFQSLSETDVRRVTDEITRLGEVPAQQLTQVMTEFYGLLETQQYMVRGGPEYALKLLTEAFGASKAEDLLAQVKKIRERDQRRHGDGAEHGAAASEQVSGERASADGCAGAGASGCEARVGGADESAWADAGGCGAAAGGDAAVLAGDGADSRDGAA